MEFHSVSLTNENLANLPNIPAVYFVRDNDGEVLYVGQSQELHNRWKYHNLIERQLSCVDYWRMDLCWYSGAEDIYKLEKEKIAEWRPAWNCKDNKDYYRPTHKLDFVAFSVKCVSYYGVISKKRKKNVTYKDTTRERIRLRKKTFAYGDIPRNMIKYESFLEELRLECPITYKDLEIIMERRKKEGEDMSRYKVFKSILWRRENCGRIYRERYAGKGSKKYPKNFTSIKDKLKQRHRPAS